MMWCCVPGGDLKLTPDTNPHFGKTDEATTSSTKATK